ncbi:hypothetical protein Tco_1396678 [Tanacetum coccineum]
MQFLMGLDDIYQPIRSSLLTKEPLPDVKTAFSLISREESHRGSSFGSTGTKFSVFAAKKAPAIMHSNLNCGLPGHPIEKCYKIVSNNITSSLVEVPTSPSTQLTPEQIQKLLNLLNSKPAKNVQANMAGLTPEENNGDW